MPEQLTVHHPQGYPAKPVTRQRLAPRLEALDGKTVYLVDARFDDSDILLAQIQAWFAEHMPNVTTRYKPMSNNVTYDDPDTWAEIRAEGDAAIIAVGH